MINPVAKHIIRKLEINSFVETGIWQGKQIKYVSDWFNEFFGENYKMFEVDVKEEYVDSVKERYKENDNIFPILADSEEWLKENINLFKDNRTLFFLDAHWYEKLPLRGEIESVLTLNNKPIIAIDDYLNPFNVSARGYDVYNGTPIGTEFIRDLIQDRVEVVVHCNKPQDRSLEPLGLGEGGNQCAFLFIDETIENVISFFDDPIFAPISFYPLPDPLKEENK